MSDELTNFPHCFTKVVYAYNRCYIGYNAVFQNDEEFADWKERVLPKLEAEHGALTLSVQPLDNLKMGDEVRVIGEGTDLFIIETLKCYGDYRYSFGLDSGWREEVAKCYKPDPLDDDDSELLSGLL